MLGCWILWSVLVTQTWTLQGEALQWIWVEGVAGKVQEIVVTRSDSGSPPVLTITSSATDVFGSKTSWTVHRTLQTPYDSVLMRWVQSPGPPGIVVTRDGKVLSEDDLTPYLTLAHRLGYPMLLGASLSVFLTPLFAIPIGFWLGADRGKRRDFLEAVQRWRTGERPSWNANELAWIVGIVRDFGDREAVQTNRWVRSLDAWSSSLEFWTYTRHLVGAGIRFHFYNLYASEEDHLGNPLTVAQFQGMKFQSILRVAPLHGPMLTLAAYLGIGIEFQDVTLTRWTPGYRSPAFEGEATRTEFPLLYGLQVWVRIPHTRFLATLDVRQENRLGTAKWKQFQVGVGYAF